MTGKRNERPIKGWNEEELVEMLAATRRINGEQDLAALLEVIAREAARLLDCDRSSIFFLDRDRCELWSRAALGTDEDLRFDARLGIAGEVALTGSAVVVQDAYSDARFNPSIDARLGYRTRCILAVPLFGRDGRVLGVFEVLNKRSGSFHQNDQKILVELGGHASLAMETALKFDELQKEKNALQKQNRMLLEEVRGQFSTRNILGMTRPIQQLIRKVEELRDNRVDVLITGESGTGKELVARAIHFSGGRAGGPFVALNCSALPENLVEAELFGIEKGVATGVDRRIGRFEAADGGTLFLDEIGDLSPAAQAKILRVLQERALVWVAAVQFPSTSASWLRPTVISRRRSPRAAFVTTSTTAFTSFTFGHRPFGRFARIFPCWRSTSSSEPAASYDGQTSGSHPKPSTSWAATTGPAMSESSKTR